MEQSSSSSSTTAPSEFGVNEDEQSTGHRRHRRSVNVDSEGSDIDADDDSSGIIIQDDQYDTNDWTTNTDGTLITHTNRASTLEISIPTTMVRKRTHFRRMSVPTLPGAYQTIRQRKGAPTLMDKSSGIVYLDGEDEHKIQPTSTPTTSASASASASTETVMVNMHTSFISYRVILITENREHFHSFIINCICGNNDFIT
jgi:hypothetical protein